MIFLYVIVIILGSAGRDVHLEVQLSIKEGPLLFACGRLSLRRFL